MLTSFARHEPAAVQAARRTYRLNRRTRLERRAYVFTAAPSVRLAHATAIRIPLRPAITGLGRPALGDAARQRFGLRPDGPVLMVTGGSQGAGAINAAVSGAGAALRATGVQVPLIVICRCAVARRVVAP